MAPDPIPVTLLSNVREVAFRDLRLWAHAIVVEPGKVRGFSVTGGLPVFEAVLAGTESFELESREDAPAGATPWELRVGDETLVLWRADEEQPVCRDDVPEGHGDVLWLLLERRVAEHWQAPFMPVAEWFPADAVRQGMTELARRRDGARGGVPA